MARITEALKELATYSQENLKILSGLNDAFYTNKDYIDITVNETGYKIPSFLSLSKKLTDLSESFDRIVNAPKTGSAAYNFDGNTRKIFFESYENVPAIPDFSAAAKFSTYNPSLFKDLIAPSPALNFSFSSVPSDINSVFVRKIKLLNSAAYEQVSNYLPTDASPLTVDYSELIACLKASLTENVDYSITDKEYQFTIAQNGSRGSWIISNIIEQTTSDDGSTFFKLSLDGELVYYDELKEKTALKVGDILLVDGDKTQLQLTAIDTATNIVTVKVLNGAWANIKDKNSGAAERYYTLSFFNKDYLISSSCNRTAYIPLDNTQYIFVFPGVINGFGVRSVLESGLGYDVFKLLSDKDISFADYYKSVNNIGQKLLDMTSYMTEPVSNYKIDSISAVTSYVPAASYLQAKVFRSNSHLGNTSNLTKIKSLYQQKVANESTKSDLQNDLDSITNEINTTDFSLPTSKSKDSLNLQKKNLESQISELTNSINRNLSDITSLTAGNDTPVENAEYAVYGYIDTTTALADINALLSGENDLSIYKVNVLYRKRNVENTVGNVINFNNTVFSDWKNAETIKNLNEIGISDGTIIHTETSESSEQKFSQFVVPITQNEIVEFKYNITLSAGQPFVDFNTATSETVSVSFPTEFLRTQEINSILSNVNSDVDVSNLTTLLDQKGISDHVGNSVTDNNIKFWHTADHITSGFVSSEQKIISLKEKLQDMSAKLTSLYDDVYGTVSGNLNISLITDSMTLALSPYSNNTLQLPDYSSMTTTETEVTQNITMKLSNPTSHVIRVYPLFYGDATAIVLPTESQLVSAADYTGAGTDTTPMIHYYEGTSELTTAQLHNQLFYLRNKNKLTGEAYTINSDGDYFISPFPTATNPDFIKAHLTISAKNKIVLANTETTQYIQLAPGDVIELQLSAAYKLIGKKSTSLPISFDIRTNLISEPTYYQFNLTANY